MIAARKRLPDSASGAPYPERPDPKWRRLDATLTAAWEGIARRSLAPWTRASLARFAALAETHAPALADLSDPALRDRAEALRAPLVRHGMRPDLAAHAFALAREASRRVLGLRHHTVQLMGGAAMLRGALAEMDTGEGKTITALLPSVAFALAGRPVHVITVNDYLAARDAEQLRPVLAALGISTGLVVLDDPPDLHRAAYAADVTYCTNKDLVFDYLRDRMALGASRGRARLLVEGLAGGRPAPLLLRGLHVAIVDEADSVLIDEARTPLILSGGDGAPEAAEFYAAALALSEQLVPGHDYRLIPAERSLHLTATGRARLAILAEGRPGLWAIRRAREELAEQALQARHWYRLGQQYVVAEGKVQIVDEFTGRIMPDRSWERGLHQMVEAKEGVEITGRRRTLSRITYQRFFRRYFHLCGMTGTAAEVAGELRAVYDLRVARIPTHHPSRRRNTGIRVLATDDAKWAAVVREAEAMAEAGRAVLIGTRSVAASRLLADKLAATGRTAAVLNAEHHAEEAAIIAEAGAPGRITVATNMAGRGTDIKPTPEVKQEGGLHVILTEFHESARIDRQLYGRGGRQGDPGSHASITSLDDEIFSRFVPASWLAFLRASATANGGLLPDRLARLLRSWAQSAAERLNASTRRNTLANDQQQERMLAFSGRGE
jgi:preprotein translocase subunit SecA